jgi:hypothetical protein
MCTKTSTRVHTIQLEIVLEAMGAKVLPGSEVTM